MQIEVVENPRYKKRRSTRKRKTKRVTVKRRKTSYRSRRKNPLMMTYKNPRKYRRRKNPLIPKMDIKNLLFMAGGAVGTTIIPGLLGKFVPGLPSTGLTGKVVQAAGAMLLGKGVGMFAGKRAGEAVFQGAMVAIITDLLKIYVMPKVGLGGYVYASELSPVLSDLSGYTYSGTQEIPGTMEAAIL